MCNSRAEADSFPMNKKYIHHKRKVNCMPNKLYKQFKCLDKTALGIVTKAYNEYKFPVPFKPPVGISDRFMQITIDDFPKGSLLESYLDYSQSELLAIHMKRLGNTVDEDNIKSGILTVYVMMLHGIVVVGGPDSFGGTTRYYTLNPDLAANMCGRENVDQVTESIRENAFSIFEDNIKCYEIIPKDFDTSFETGEFDCAQGILYMERCQTITFLESALRLRDEFIRKIKRCSFNIEYYDIFTKEIVLAATDPTKERVNDFGFDIGFSGNTDVFLISIPVTKNIFMIYSYRQF